MCIPLFPFHPILIIKVFDLIMRNNLIIKLEIRWSFMIPIIFIFKCLNDLIIKTRDTKSGVKSYMVLV